MNLSHAYGTPPSEAEAERLLLSAFELGVRHFDSAALYGFGANETLLGRVLKPHRSQVLLVSKGGMAGVQFPDGMKRVIDGSPEAITRNCEDSLRRLQTDCIDLYYLHRWHKAVPIEDSMGAMARLVERGLVRAVGLSEVSAATLRRAHAVHPVAAVQSEYSLWSRNVEVAVLAACREIGAAFVAFSPLARAYLTGTLTDVSTLMPKDIRRGMPRFQPGAYAANLALLPPYLALARELSITPGQLALAWVLAQGPHVHVIPGTAQIAHLQDNVGAAGVELTAEQLAMLDSWINTRTVTGPRYNAQSSGEVDTEEV